MKYSSKNISDIQVLESIIKMRQLDMKKYCYEILVEELGYPEKVCYAALERVDRKGYIDYGVSLRTAWINEKGYELLEKNLSNRDTISMRQCFKMYCRGNDIVYKTGESGVPKWFKDNIKSTFYNVFINNRYYVDLSLIIREII